jgi:hypothetical protein
MKFRRELALSEKWSKQLDLRRRQRINEAVSWEPGKRKPRGYPVWSKGEFVIKLQKPGKEATRKGERKNRYDMLPVVFEAGERATKNASFKDLFIALYQRRPTRQAGRLLGALLVRSAYMEDHIEARKGKWRYDPNLAVISRIRRDIRTIFGLPILEFLHYVDALAWNEDVKYQKGLRRRKNKKKKKRRGKLANTGRPKYASNFGACGCR